MPTEGLEPARAQTVPVADIDGDVVTKLSPWSLDDTVSRLSAVAAARGMKVFAVIDHSGEAQKVGLELRDTKVVFFGNPQAGTPVMVAAPLAALDLPLKVLVWVDGDQTKVSYTAPATLATRYGLDGKLGSRLAGIVEIANAVIDNSFDESVSAER